jgi:short-subunit dehydrogenase
MSKIVLITGASSGIGKSMASYLQQQGLSVYGTSRNSEHGQVIDGITFLKLDVTNDQSVHDAVSYLLEKEGKIDVLINNAGIGMVGSGEDSTPIEMKVQFETNFYGTVRLMQAVLPSMRNRKEGLIINISSLAGLFGLPYRGVYSAAKFAINGLSESMRMELISYGVHLSVICPGDFKTPIKTSRIRAKKSESSVYKEEFDKVYTLMNEELDNSGDPVQVAKMAFKIIGTKEPRPFYFVASAFQKCVVMLRYWIPTKAFQWLMMRNYKMLK